MDPKRESSSSQLKEQKQNDTTIVTVDCPLQIVFWIFTANWNKISMDACLFFVPFCVCVCVVHNKNHNDKVVLEKKTELSKRCIFSCFTCLKLSSPPSVSLSLSLSLSGGDRQLAIDISTLDTGLLMNATVIMDD